MHEKNRYNKMIIGLLVLAILLFALFVLPNYEIRDSQSRRINRFIESDIKNYTLDEVKDILGEPLYVSEDERRIYFSGGKSYYIGYTGKYKEYDFYISLDENNEYIENVCHVCRMEIPYGLSTLILQ